MSLLPLAWVASSWYIVFRDTMVVVKAQFGVKMGKPRSRYLVTQVLASA
jgi:hypothetical protein